MSEPHAADELMPLVYDELRRLAAAKLAHEKPGQTLDATALVHEAYVRLMANPGRQPGGDLSANAPPDLHPGFANRRHFFAAAAEAMRRILIEHARQKASLKRGGDRQRVPISEIVSLTESPDGLLAVDEALDHFAAEEPQKAELVKLRFFAGLTMPEAALALGISLATAERWWTYSKAWLFAELSDSE